MICPKCGAKALDGADFCRDCGTKLSDGNVQQNQSNANNSQAQTQPGGSPANTPKKKRFKKLPIIIGAVILIFIALIVIGSDDSSDDKEQTSSAEMKLSQTYTNEEEGISFKYPSAWVPVSEDELAKEEDDLENMYVLVVLENINEDLPENTTTIGVSKYKFTATQDDLDLFFKDNDRFIESIGDEVSVKDISITKLDGVTARKFTFFDPNTNMGTESWIYVVDFEVYRIDFNWVGEDPGDNQRFFDAVIDSYKITVDEADDDTVNTADTADKPTYNGIPVDTIMQMKAEDIVDAFGEPEYSSESYLEIRNEEGVFIAMVDFDSTGYVSCFSGDPKRFGLNGRDFNYDYDTLIEIFGRKPDSEEMHDLFELRWNYNGYLIIVYLDTDGLPARTDVWNENAYDDSQTYEETYDENYIDENFEWVQKPVLTNDFDPYFPSSYIEGIVKNKTDKTFSITGISFNLYDAAGNQVDTASDIINNLSGNNTWKFKARVSANKGISRFEFAEITAY